MPQIRASCPTSTNILSTSRALDKPALDKPARIKGRGSRDNPAGRFEVTTHEAVDDGWYQDGEPAAPPRTQVSEERARHIISSNVSPDVPFDTSINTYRGCEHGCAYCYARPSHAYLNLSPGLDFETKLFAKTNAAEILRKDLSKRGYVCSAINLGANTDVYQPIEKRYRITREVLEVLNACNHPCTIITKNALIERDIDILQDMAARKLVHVFVSVTSLDNQLSSRLEPRATAPHRRIQTIAALTERRHPDQRQRRPHHPRADRHLDRSHHRTGRRRRRRQRRLHRRAPAVGTQATLGRLARNPLPRAKAACAQRVAQYPWR